MDLPTNYISEFKEYALQLAEAFKVGIVISKPIGGIVLQVGYDSHPIENVRNVDLHIEGGVNFNLEISSTAHVFETALNVIEKSLNFCLNDLYQRYRIERYEMFLDTAADWFWESGPDNRFVYLSGKVEDVLGLPPAQIIGHTRRELHDRQHDISTPQWLAHLKRLERHEPYCDFETRWMRPDGGIRHISLSGQPIWTPKGEFAGYRGTGLDITGKKQAQIDFQNLVEGSIQGICIHRHWEFVFVNPALVKMCGYDSAQEFLAVGSVEKMIAPYERERLYEYRLAKEKGEQIDTHHVADYLTKSGDVITLESINSLIEWKGQKAILSTVIDVTEQKKAEQRLQEHHDQLQVLVAERTQDLMTSEQRFRNAAEAASDWFWETDENHKVTFISERFYELFDLTHEDVLGKSRLEIVENQMKIPDVSQVWSEHLESLNDHKPFSIRYWVRGRSADEICIEIKGKPLFEGDGVFKGYIGAGSDVTQEVKTEEALRVAVKEAESANSAKSDFLSNMSHELRTPLNAILGFAQLLESNGQANMSERQLMQLKHIRLGGEHLLELVNEILDLSKIEAGKLTIIAEDVDLKNLIDICLPYASAFSEKYNVKIEDRSVDGLPLIWADALRAKQALLNLLSNAAKYNQENGTVWIDTMRTSDGFVRVTIRDNGIGIRESDKEKIFQPFQRAAGQDGVIEGTGIGLVLTKKLLEEMGGRIGFESNYGEGSAFWLDFPASVTSEKSNIASVQLQQVDGRSVCAPQNQYTMLYVEDNPSNLSLMAGIVDCIPNLRMVSAHTAEIGLTMLQAQKPDLVLMDINLPGMDGFQAVREIRALKDVKDMPVFAISADALSDTISKGQEAGFDRYLTKPIDLPHFMSILDEVLK